ncbi:MAG: PAS domain S-box protein, partial [Alphaproteobacteria bacterium]|nr:PAS domain S-box protein [Alphaproteobacteria bacterium]
YRDVRKPNADEIGHISRLAGLAAVAIELDELRRANELAATAFGAAREGIIVTDKSGAILSVNPGFERITGYSASEVVGKNPRVLKSGRHGADFYAQMWDRLLKHGRWQGEIWNRRKDGNLFCEYLSVTAHRDSSGLATGYVGVVTDLTEVVEMRAALDVNRRRFDDFLKVAADWFWEQDENLRFTFVSSENEVHSGLGSAEHIGKTRYETNPLGVTAAAWAEHEALLAARKSFRDFRIGRVNRSGEERVLSISGIPVFDAEGVFRGYRGTGRDITEELSSRATADRFQLLLQSVLDNAPVDVIFKDAKLRYVVLPRATARRWGLEVEDMVGKSLPELADRIPAHIGFPGIIETIDALDRKALEGNQAVSFAHEHTALDGTRRWLEGTRIPLRDKDGRILGLILCVGDITARHELEETLARERDRANEANRTKSAFLARMSHELRTPLNAIIGFAQILQREGGAALKPAQTEEFIHNIEEAGTHLLAIINDLLDLTRFEAGRIVPQEGEVRLGAALRSVLPLVAPTIEVRSILLRSDIDESIRLKGDARLIRQAVINVLANAAKFAPDRGHVVLRLERRREGEVAIIVTDDGIGIPADRIAALGTPFSALETDYARNPTGTGLGLAIVRYIMEGHQGRLEIASEVGKGTVVSLIFPAERVLR